MRLVISRRPLHRILKWIQRVLLTGAVVTLAYCGYVIVDARMFQKEERRQLETLLIAPVSPGISTPVARGGMIGRIEIERLGISVMVIEGISGKTLRRAVGHIPGTALPGHAGNVAISGHRDTFFRPLRNIRQDDMITLTTLRGRYNYRVVSTKIVNPNDVSVLNAGTGEILTLVTCYPFYFVGSAPDRFIVRAERVI
jgi:sortase A